MNLPDGDYTLSEGAAWLSVKGFAIRVHSTGEGVIVDIFDDALAKTGEFDAALVTSTYAYDSEVRGWNSSPCPVDPSNFWLDDDTGERVSAATGERLPAPWEDGQVLGVDADGCEICWDATAKRTYNSGDKPC